MKRIILLLLCVVASMTYGQTGQKNFIDQNYIEVIGVAEMEIIPDEIYVKIIINEKDNKAKQSLEDLERDMYLKLEEIGIDVAKDLAIKDFASNFKSYWLKKSDILTMKEYQLIVHNSPTLGAVYVELEKLGISNITIDKVDHSEIQDFKKEVKTKAIQAAKYKAEYLASSIDQTIGKALYINEINNVSRSLQVRAMGANIMIRGSESIKGREDIIPNIEFEKIKLSSSIHVKFELH